MTIYKPKECTICNKMFVPNHPSQSRCPGPHYKQCPVCGKQMPWTEYDRCCSKECASAKRKKTNLAKYGVDCASKAPSVMAKARATNRLHNGVDYPAQNATIQKKQLASFKLHFDKNLNPDGYDDLERRKKSTCLKKYGTEYSFQSTNNKEKSKKTSLERYGTAYPMQSNVVKENYKKGMIAKYGVDNIMKCPELVEKMKIRSQQKYGFDWAIQSPDIRAKISTTIQEKYGVPWYCMTEDCKNSNGHVISKLNERFSQFLTQHHLEHELEFTLESYSFDFKIENLLLELDPTWTHNCLFNPFDKNSPGYNQSYHLKKTRTAEINGYRCIHIFDWDDWNRVIDLFAAPSTRLYARSCNVAEIDKETADDFLNSYHIQGSCSGQAIRLGLLDQHGELVELMTFGRPRYNKNYQWELLRLCTRAGTSVIGGANKLFIAFVRKFDPDSVISYCDKAKFTGSVYANLGFSLLRETEPAKVWSKGKDKITDNLLRQRGFDQLFNANYGKGTSNEELMLDHCWLPVYDCGQQVFEWKTAN